MLPESQLRKQPVRFLVAVAAILALFFLLGVRLWYLQVIVGDEFRQLSENNRFRVVYRPPPRGLIVDRNDQVMAKSRPSFNIEFIKADSPEPEKTIARLAQILGRDPKQILSQLQDQRRRHRFEPKVAVLDASREEVARVLGHRHELPGVGVHSVPARLYVDGIEGAHVLGYTREISADQLKKEIYQDYRHGDVIGQSGVESRRENELRGSRGSQRVIVDARGARVQALPPIPESIGGKVHLTLDARVQRAADQSLEGLRGAVVAMNVRTGEILALSSAPAFDPNIFTREIGPEAWKSLNDPREFRLTNRALQGVYPPGSVFKVFMAVAALAERVTDKNERINCPGSYRVGSRVFRCHKKTGHGSVNLTEALIQSCDVYFYVMGQRLGVDRIHDYATRFGLGGLTGIDLSDEKSGLIPSTEWKHRAFRRAEDQKWYPGETPSVVIGQGAVSVTPLQVTRAMAALANGGNVLKPHIFLDDQSGPEVVNRVGVSPAILQFVRDVLTGVVYDERGTGHKAQLGSTFDVLVAGKTGTAQPASLDKQHLGEHLNDHAWFSALAPADNPEIAVTALVENGGHGGSVAAPLVRKVMEAYFRAQGREDQLSFVGPDGSGQEKPAGISVMGLSGEGASSQETQEPEEVRGGDTGSED